MELKRPNKALEHRIQTETEKMRCPMHGKQALVSMPDEKSPVSVEACCKFFEKDVLVVAERIRKDFLYKSEKTRERLERERKKGNRDSES